MEAQLRKMEKTIETSELLEIIVETEAEAGVSGMSVAGGGKQGLFVKDVLKGSPAARALSLKEGDQLLSARVYFDNMKYEDALQILKSAEPYKVSFCLKRTVPSTDVTRSPGAPTFEVRGPPKAKMAKLSIQSLTSLQKKKKPPKKAGKGLAKDLREGESAGGKLEVAPVDVEFSLPKFSKLRKARSAGEVATAARPSPDLSPLLSSLDTKRRKLRLPRLKVKEALAARAAATAGRLEGAPPKAAPEGAAGAKASRFTIPFAKGKKPKEAEAAVGLRAPQVELDLPLPKVGPGRESPRAGREGVVVQVPPLGLPEVEVVLPKGSPRGAPEESPPAGPRLPAAEVAAPKVDVALSLPRLEGGPPEVALLRGEGLQVRVPKGGVSAEGTERKTALLDVVLGKGRGQAEGPEEKATLPASLGVGLPSVGIEIPLPRGKAEAEAPKPKVEIPEVSIKVPTVSLPKLGSRPQGEGESRLPQVELSVGKRESPKAKAQVPGFGVSLMERKSEGREESKAKALGLKMPSLDIAAPKVSGMQLPKALAGPEAKAEGAAEGPRLKLQVPQVSLPKCSLPAKAVPSPAPQGPKKPEGEGGGKAGVPALSLSLPAVQLPKGHVSKPELDLCVDRPRVEVALPAAAQRLSFPSATVPALELDLPRAGVELGLPKADGERLGPPHPPPRDHEGKVKMPTLETLSKDLGVEISVPTCREEPPERQPGLEAPEGLGVGAIVAKIPQVDLALGKEEAAEAMGGEAMLPSVEVSAVKFPQVTLERGKSPEAEAKLKSPKFALPKFSISGPKAWKVSTERFGAQGEGPDEADKGSKLKLPKFGISFPKSRGGAEAEGPKPGPGEGRRSPAEEPAESRMKLPSVALPKVDVEVPQLGISLPTGKAESSDEEGAVPGLGLELPDIKRKMPKFSLPKFGGKDKEGDVELETGEALAGERGAKAKASKFKMALFGMAGRDLEGVGPEGEGKARAGAESPKEKARGPLVKMPKLKLPSPKAELGQGHLPQVELPKIGLPGATAEEALLVGSESPSLKVKVPSLEIAVPGSTTKAEALGADHRRHEAELKIPQAPSLGISVPKVELGLSLPTVGAEAPMPRGVPGAEATIQLPQVELPTFGRGEQGAAEVSKVRVPRVDLSLPAALSRMEGEGAAAEPEGRRQMPSVELPKFSTPKAGVPEWEESLEGGGKMLLPTVELSGPALRLPKFRGPSLEAEGEVEVEAGLPQLELKVPKLGGSAERLGTEAGAKEGRVTVPCPPSGFGLCRAEGEEEEAAAFGPDSRFKLKMPSLSISRAGTESRADTQPLCPSEDASFKMPHITLPGVGFSVEEDSQREARVEAGKLASAEGLGAEGLEARLKVPKIKIPALGVSVPKGGRDAAAPPQDPEGKKAAFRVPDLELAAPALKAHAEYEVEGAQLRHGGSQEREGAGGRVREGGKSPGGRGGEAPDAEAGKKYKVKIPKFGLSLPKAGEGAPGQEAEAKAKRPAFALGRPKGRGAEGSPGLLEGEEEAEGKGVMGRFKLGLSRLKMGSEANEAEPEDSSSPSKVRLPKLGFSDGEGAEAALQNGTPDGKGKLGKIRLPQVELSSPSAAAEGDPELSLKLVRAEEEAKEEGPSAFAALKFKPPKITFSGFKKRNGEPAPVAVVSSGARTEMASLERGQPALKPPKFKFPKVALSPKSHGVLEIASKGQASPKEARRGSQEGLKIQLPRVGFSEEAGGSPPRAAAEGQGKTAAAAV